MSRQKCELQQMLLVMKYCTVIIEDKLNFLHIQYMLIVAIVTLLTVI